MSNTAKQFYLDPDYRRQAIAGVPCCIRCQKPIKGQAVKVTLVNDWYVTLGGTDLLGPDCWKKISR